MHRFQIGKTLECYSNHILSPKLFKLMLVWVLVFDGYLYSRVYSMHLWSDALDVKQWSSNCLCTKIHLDVLARVQSSGGGGEVSLRPPPKKKKKRLPTICKINTVSGVILPCRLHHMQSISEDLKSQIFHGGMPSETPQVTFCTASAQTQNS